MKIFVLFLAITLSGCYIPPKEQRYNGNYDIVCIVPGANDVHYKNVSQDRISGGKTFLYLKMDDGTEVTHYQSNCRYTEINR